MERFNPTAATFGGPALTEILPIRIDDFAGATLNGKPIYTLDQVIGQLDSGRQIDGKTITFSFFDGPHTIGWYNNPHYAGAFDQVAGYSPFSEAQKEAARYAMETWDDLIAPSIVEKTGNGADIVFANSTTGPAQAGAYYPGNGPKFQGDVWVATPEANWTNAWLNFNGYGLTTLIHEAGHALGLSHPGEYNFGDDKDGDGQPDPITYEGDAFYAQDTEQFTIMSYFSPQKTGALPVDVMTGLLGNAQTPMVHDIHVIQSKYGADPTTRTGDTTYGFNSNAGRDVFDFNINKMPFLAIYDAGGEDTLDLSGAGVGVFIDLRPGSYSSIGVRPTLEEANAATEAFNAVTDEAQGDFPLWTDQAELDGFIGLVQSITSRSIANATGITGVGALSHANVGIAYNTVIENAVGGAARDYLVGNHVGNKLSGNGGNDVLNGLGGSDTLTGGAGADEFRFTELGATDLVDDFVQGTDRLHLLEIDANTTVAGNQGFTFVTAFTGAAGQLMLSYDDEADVTTVRLDVNGDGQSDMDIRLAGEVTSSAGWVL